MDASQPARAIGSSTTRYLVPAARHRAEMVVERSRFLCTMSRVESVSHAQAFVREVQTEFADATHNCWAYVVGAPGSTSQIGLSDDGEPHGTAGRPMLTVLLHSGVGEVAAVVTRWYGGVKLGTGGLARAYSNAVQLALSSLTTAHHVERVALEICMDYSAVTPVQQLFTELAVVVADEQYAEQVRYRVLVAHDEEALLRDRLADLTRGQARVTP